MLSGSPEDIAARTTGLLFAAAPAAVVANGTKPAQVAAAAAIAVRAHAPLLLTSGQPGRAANGLLRAEIRALNPGAVLAVGIPARQLSALLPHVHVVARASSLPRTGRRT